MAVGRVGTKTTENELNTPSKAVAVILNYRLCKMQVGGKEGGKKIRVMGHRPGQNRNSTANGRKERKGGVLRGSTNSSLLRTFKTYKVKEWGPVRRTKKGTGFAVKRVRTSVEKGGELFGRSV